MQHRFTILALVTLSLACGGGGGYSDGDPTGPSAPPSGATIRAEPSLVFSPDRVTVTAGGGVTFAFGSVAHNVIFDSRNGAPADITGATANTSVSRTFATAGTFPFTCTLHPGMAGTVVVNAPPPEGSY